MSYGRFGVREICDVVFRPLSSLDIGNQHFDKMQPCLYLDTAQTSSLEGAATTVYAQGGKGNPRLIAWEGERTLTLNITDALMSTISFAMLSGAGVVESWEKGHNAAATLQEMFNDQGCVDRAVFMHTTYEVVASVTEDGSITATVGKDVLGNDFIYVSQKAPVYAVSLNNAGGVRAYLGNVRTAEIEGEKIEAHKLPGGTLFDNNQDIVFTLVPDTATDADGEELGTSGSLHQGVAHNPMVNDGDVVRIDCYTAHITGATQMNIDAENFAGFYYIEADTLFRDEETGKDFPAEFVIPRGKIQSNFTFSMASSGDPSTFDFVIDCFPGYTSFSNGKKVLAQLNVIDPAADESHPWATDVHGHETRKGDVDLEKFWEA